MNAIPRTWRDNVERIDAEIGWFQQLRAEALGEAPPPSTQRYEEVRATRHEGPR